MTNFAVIEVVVFKYINFVLMKRLLFFSLMIIPLMPFAQGLNAIYSFTSYNVPSKSPYVEVNLSIDAKSVKYENVEEKSEGKVEVVLVIRKDTNIVYAQKRILNAILSNDNNASIFDLQRIGLENGKYYANFEIKDMNTDAEALIILDSFIVDYQKNIIAVSDVQLIDSYTKSNSQNIRSKNGYDIIPYLFDAVPESKNQITYYAEIYNADKQFGLDNNYILSVCLEDLNTGKKFESIQKIIREQAKEVSVVMGNLNIEELPQGGYYLLVEARDANNILYAYKKIPFVRYSSKQVDNMISALPSDAFVNGISEKDIDEYLYCLLPIATETQKGFLNHGVKKAGLEEKKIFLFNFWRMINADNPAAEWKYYMDNVDYVNKKYSTKIKKGYQTDMGRIYLVYGKPDHIVDEKFKTTGGIKRRTLSDKLANPDAEDASADGVAYQPYQIWKYSKTPYGEMNKSFVFYAKQNNLMEYFLLHSNAKGELFDMYWENKLTRNLLPEGVEGEAGVQFRRGY